MSYTLSRNSSSLARLSAPQVMSTSVSQPVDSNRLSAIEVKSRSSSADRPSNTLSAVSSLLDDSDDDETVKPSATQLSIDLASDSEQSSDESTKSIQLSRSLSQSGPTRKPRRAQPLQRTQSSGHSKPSAAASRSAPVSAKRSLTSALGSSSSGGSAPKRAKSTTGLAADDAFKRSQAKVASLQLRCNRLEQELHSAQLRASVAESTQRQLAQARQAAEAADQCRRRVASQLSAEKKQNRQLQTQVNELHHSLQAAMRLAASHARPASTIHSHSQSQSSSSASAVGTASASVSGQPRSFHRSAAARSSISQSLNIENLSDNDQQSEPIDLCSPSQSTSSSDNVELPLSHLQLPAQLPSVDPTAVEFSFANTNQPGEFIRVGSINIHGMGRWRTGDSSSINALFQAIDVHLIDIACIQETWLRPDDVAVEHFKRRDEFTFINAPRPNQSRSRPCGSGGVAMLVRTDRWDSITQVRDRGARYETLWVKLKRDSFVLFVASVYRPPSQPSRQTSNNELTDNPMDLLCADVCELSQQGSVIVAGDFNHRIGTLPSHIPDRAPCIRLSQDLAVEPDAAARDFVARCDASSLLIVNGLFGREAEFTNICAGQVRSESTSVPSSVVDLVCIHSNDTHLLVADRGLEVNHLPALSPEHALIVLPLFRLAPTTSEADLVAQHSRKVHHSKPANRQRTSMTPESTEALQRRLCQMLDDAFATSSPSQPSTSTTDVQSAASQLESSVVSALSDCVTSTPVKGKPAGMLQMPKSAELRAATKEKNDLLYSIKASAACPEQRLLERFRIVNTRVKQLHRAEFVQWHESLMSQLRACKVAGDAKRYWMTLKRMAGWVNGKSQVPTGQVICQGLLLSGRDAVFDTWQATFANVLSEADQAGFCSGIGSHQHLIQRLVALVVTKHDTNHVLNQAISHEEVLLALRQSHSGKAAGADNIPMEAYKCTAIDRVDANNARVNPVLRSIAHLFNLICSQEQLPKSWSHSLIMPLFKSGDARDPLNWRPIALIPSIAKLFSTVLHNRLEDWCESGERLSQNQFGFRKGLSTAEPLFILSEALDHYVVERKLPLYVCFIDVRKAYDLLWRDGLIARLHSIGVKGSMLRIIRAMLENTTASVLINDLLTEPIAISNGLKQGDNLSPLLFNIFFDSLSHCLNATSSPAIPKVSIGSVEFNHLMYADDLMLVADHPASLQTVLTLTAEHFRKWRLTLNFAKSKVVAFDRQPAMRSNVELAFTFGEGRLRSSYTHSGLLLISLLIFKQHKANRLQAALSRMHRLHWMRRKGHLMHIRDSIEAHEMLLMSALESDGHVCSYGRSAWPAVDQLMHQSACKILEVHSLSTHCALRGELGWLTYSERSDQAHLMYLGRLIQSKSPNQLARRVLVARKESAAKVGISWCRHVLRLVRKYGLEQELRGLDVALCQPSQSEMSWSTAVKCKVRALAEQKWITQSEQMSKLVTYRLVKSTLRLEPYLLTESSRRSACLLTQLRCGTNGLAVDRMRRAVNGVQIARADRVCLNCDNHSNAVEDEPHVLLDCPRYERHRLWLHAATLSLSAGAVNLQTMPAEHKLRYLMGTINGPWLAPARLRQEQLDLLLAFVHQVMTDQAGRAAYWRERRVQVGWQFGIDGSLTLDVSTSIGSGFGEEEVVVTVD